jgi:RNA polymerase sigma factor (sigma-70 family)
MAKYTYKTVTGNVTIEVSDEWLSELHTADRMEYNSEQKQNRANHKYALGAPLSIEEADPECTWIREKVDCITDVETAIDLEYALDTLTVLQRNCFTEVRLNGQTQKEASEKLGISRESVKQAVSLALKHLKKIYS